MQDSEIAELSYEQARQALSDVVVKLETGGATLEESLALWALSEKLADRCEEVLDAVSDQLAELDEDDEVADDEVEDE